MARNKTTNRRRHGKAAPATDPSAALTGLELEARRSERLKTVEVLKQGRTPLVVLDLADHTIQLAEAALGKATAISPPPLLACREGCDWCCYMRVGTSAAEVLRIAAYLRQTQSAEQLQATRDRVAQLADRRRELKSNQRADSRLPCALLVDHRCSVYPVRPLTCRGCNSTDAQRCEQFVQQPDRVVVPDYKPQLRLSTFVLDGLRAGLAEAKLQGDLLELTAALRIALEVPDAAERWLAGEPVFAGARLP